MVAVMSNLVFIIPAVDIGVSIRAENGKPDSIIIATNCFILSLKTVYDMS